MKEIILQKSNFRCRENIYICRPLRRLRRLAVEYVKKFNEIKDEYSYCTLIYTDGSKDNDRVGCGLIINNLSIKQSLTRNGSSFTAEVTAIDLALDTIAESDGDHFIIFFDSLSVLLSRHNKKWIIH